MKSFLLHLASPTFAAAMLLSSCAGGGKSPESSRNAAALTDKIDWENQRIAAHRPSTGPYPHWPAGDPQHKQSGEVIVEYQIGPTGTVLAAKVVSSTNPFFNHSALMSARSQKFPARGKAWTARQPVVFNSANDFSAEAKPKKPVSVPLIFTVGADGRASSVSVEKPGNPETDLRAIAILKNTKFPPSKTALGQQTKKRLVITVR